MNLTSDSYRHLVWRRQFVVGRRRHWCGLVYLQVVRDVATGRRIRASTGVTDTTAASSCERLIGSSHASRQEDLAANGSSGSHCRCRPLLLQLVVIARRCRRWCHSERCQSYRVVRTNNDISCQRSSVARPRQQLRPHQTLLPRMHCPSSIAHPTVFGNGCLYSEKRIKNIFKRKILRQK